MERLREPAVAGLFYPAREAALVEAVEQCWRARVPGAEASRVMVVPHAGLPYSGCVAATAYAALAGTATPTRIGLLGPPHRLPVDGVAAVSATGFATPQGTLRVDYPDVLLAVPRVHVSDAAHRAEHCLEVQLPFLHRLWGDRPAIAPLLVGDAEPSLVADIIELLLDDRGALLLVSSDLSHYHDYATARDVDAGTIKALETGAPPLGPAQACGCNTLNGLLEYCRRHDRRLQALDVRNSGDTAGGRDRVVGYAALALR